MRGPLASEDSGAPAQSGRGESAQQALTDLGRRFAAAARVTVVVAASLVALLTEPTRISGIAVALVAIAWNVVFCRLLYFAPRPRLVLLDTAVVSAICLSQPWSAPPELDFDGMTWWYAVAAITVVTNQLHTGRVTGATSTAAIVGAYLVGIALAEPETWQSEAPFALWMVAEAFLARCVRVVVLREGRVADRLLARAERIRRDAEVVEARRAAEQGYLAALHDTASATLLMVGTGVLPGPEPWLAEQARRDLEVIQGTAEAMADEVDLIAMLRDVARLTPLQVAWRSGDELRLPARVAEALCGATREALTNVVRHAGVTAAEITVESGQSLVVEIVDQGRGFSPRRVPAHRYGLTGSLDARLAGVGGRASIVSRPGRGTRVRLEVPSVAA